VTRPEGIPFDPFRGSLYSVEDDLYAGYVIGQPGGYAATRDARIYAHFCATGRSNPPSILESLYRRLHDHGMSDALEESIAGHRIVAIMGGHRLARDAEEYRAVALLGRALARASFVVVTGGGPGAMEAAHLGAWHAGRRDEDLDTALAILGHAPLYTPIEPWLDTDIVPTADRLISIRLRSADPDDLSLREARLLGQADTLYHRADAPAAILDRTRADATRICCPAPPETVAPGLSIDLDFA